MLVEELTKMMKPRMITKFQTLKRNHDEMKRKYQRMKKMSKRIAKRLSRHEFIESSEEESELALSESSNNSASNN